MNEDLENARADSIKKTLSRLTAIIEDDKADFEKIVVAANLVRGFSQDHILSDLSEKGMNADSSFKDKLIKQADKNDERLER